jgi:hypothetical protein
LSKFDDSWRDLDYTPAVDRWFSRSAERWGKPNTDPVREFHRGEPATQGLIDDYLDRGGMINRGEERVAEQKVYDRRHYDRQRRNGNLMKIVTDVVAAWDSSDYLARHRKVVKDILGLERNARRRKLEGLPTMARRHQQTLRLVHALAFDGIDTAEYCRRHKLDKADASRMLQHLYEKESGLRDAIGAISACATATSWQFRQQQQVLHQYMKKNRRRLDVELAGTFSESRLVYGLDPNRDIIGDGWLCDYNAGSIRNTIGGRFKPCALVRDILYDGPFEPLDLHKPAMWTRPWTWTLWDREPLGFWDALYEPLRAVQRYERLPDRYRDISRRVLLKDQVSKRTWSITRSLDDARPQYASEPDDFLAAWLRWVSQRKELPVGSAPEPPHGIFHRRFRPVSPIHAVMKIRPDQLVIFVSRGSSMEDCQGVAPPSRTDKFTVQRGRIEAGVFVPKGTPPLCTPVHSGQMLVAAKSGVLETELRWALYGQRRPARRLVWIALPPVRKPHGLIRPLLGTPGLDGQSRKPSCCWPRKPMPACPFILSAR